MDIILVKLFISSQQSF